MYVYQEGKSVFKFAVTKMADVSAEIMQRNQLAGEDINWLVPHQANLRITQFVQKKLGLKDKQVYSNIHKYGNTTAGTIPIELAEVVNYGMISMEDIVILKKLVLRD